MYLYVVLPPFQILVRLTFFDPKFDSSFYSKNLYKYYLFFMTYYITKDILIINYLFYNLYKNLNKMNSQT